MKTTESKECNPMHLDDKRELYKTVKEERRRAELVKKLGIREPMISPPRQEAFSRPYKPRQ